jgi:hypothetical protein
MEIGRAEAEKMTAKSDKSRSRANRRDQESRTITGYVRQRYLIARIIGSVGVALFVGAALVFTDPGGGPYGLYVFARSLLQSYSQGSFKISQCGVVDAEAA